MSDAVIMELDQEYETSITPLVQVIPACKSNGFAVKRKPHGGRNYAHVPLGNLGLHTRACEGCECAEFLCDSASRLRQVRGAQLSWTAANFCASLQ